MPSAIRVRWATFRVTVVCVVSLLILLTLAILLTGGTLLERKAHLYLEVPDATGLDSGSPVRVDGIIVGKVDRVVFSGSTEPNRVIRLQLSIEHERLASITNDSIAQISNDSVVGDKYVDITSGKAPEHVPENGQLRFKAQPDLMRSIDIPAFEAQLRSVDATLADIEHGRNQLGQFWQGDQVYRRLQHRFDEAQAALHSAVQTTGNVGSVLYTDAKYQALREPWVRFDRKLAEIQSGQTTLGSYLRDPAKFEEFRSDIASLRKALTDFRSSDLIQSASTYESVTRTVADLGRSVDDFNANPMFVSSDLYERLNGSAREVQHNVKDFRENPKKYLRLKIF